MHFEDAALVFDDPLSRIRDDSAHEPGRYQIIGRPYPDREDVLFVVYVEIDHDAVWIICARHTTMHERKRYDGSEEGRRRRR